VIIQDDAHALPRAFLWVGALDRLALEQAIAAAGHSVPHSLFEFWLATGGGVAFETEEFAAPLGNTTLVESVAELNAGLRARGMDGRYLVFQRGVFVSAVRQSDLRFVTLTDGTWMEDSEYPTFDEWYRKTLRAEYAERYGMSTNPRGSAPV
jgi:hypothetical protein